MMQMEELPSRRVYMMPEHFEAYGGYEIFITWSNHEPPAGWPCYVVQRIVRCNKGFINTRGGSMPLNSTMEDAILAARKLIDHLVEMEKEFIRDMVMTLELKRTK